MLYLYHVLQLVGKNQRVPEYSQNYFALSAIGLVGAARLLFRNVIIRRIVEQITLPA